ncbi:MAG: GGDEF domain-containing protein [Lachnospiraceae bacterium]|nr:GGDEF domain-containing protein [Lachnospiraceae bacterium]
MGNFSHYIKGIRNGEVFFDEQFKFSFILHEVGLLHLLFSVLFYIMGNRVLGIYNVCVFLGYLSIDYLIKFKKFRLSLIIACTEVMLHSFLTTVTVGINTGFSFYCFSMVPCVFYMILTWNVFKRKEITSILYTSAFALALIGNCMISFFVEPKTPAPFGWAIAFSSLNAVMSVVAMAEFLIMLDWDVMHKSEKMQSLNDELGEKANIDPLTKLYNRRFMDQKLEEKLTELSKEGNIFGIIMADIDDFKKVNDTYGHDFGDRILVEVAAALKKSTRDDDFVCRWGGEEFLIIINGNKSITKDVAERMRTAVSEIGVPFGNDIIKVTMTFGVTESITGFSVDKLVSVADDNLYKGKQNGKNQVVG